MTQSDMVVAGKPGPLANLGDLGESVVRGKETRLPLSGKGSAKGNYLVAKYLGTSSFKYVPTDKDKEVDEEGKAVMTTARFSVVETNMEGDTGPVIPGEVCTVPFSGLLAWGLNKVATGRFVYIRFDGKGPGKDDSRQMNRFTVTDVTAKLAEQGIS